MVRRGTQERKIRMTTTKRRTVPLVLGVVVAVAAMMTTLLPAYGNANSHSSSMTMSTAAPMNARQAALYTAMRTLWAQHMEWTYATVSAFVAGSPGLQPTINRLMRNQSDIGNAVKPFYGKAAGNRLTALLKTHIADAVPVLVAAKAGDTAALGTAVKVWYRNAKQIGDFLANANPNWHRRAMETMMKTHITQTIAYASDQLQGKYGRSAKDYGIAEAHMMAMSDMLSAGLIEQFPGRFRK
jgi:hypothetical protein